MMNCCYVINISVVSFMLSIDAACLFLTVSNNFLLCPIKYLPEFKHLTLPVDPAILMMQ